MVVTLFFWSCTSDTHEVEIDHEFIGEWKLIEQYSDPGDGSGTYVPVESDRFIRFKTDGTVVTNGSFCTMTTETGAGTSAIYNIEEQRIVVENCDYELKIMVSLVGEHLILSYPCIEGCGQKFVSVAQEV